MGDLIVLAISCILINNMRPNDEFYLLGRVPRSA